MTTIATPDSGRERPPSPRRRGPTVGGGWRDAWRATSPRPAAGLVGLGYGTAATGAVATVVTLLVVALPHGVLVAPHPGLHLAIETGASVVAIISGFLALGRLRRSPRLNELALACALVLLAVTDLFFVTLPMLFDPVASDMTVWAAVFGQLTGAALFAVAAFAPRRWLRRPGTALAVAAAGLIAAVLAAVAIVDIAVGQAPRRLAEALVSGDPAVSAMRAYPAMLACFVAVAALYGVAAIGFVRSSRRFADEFLGWLALAAVLAVAMQVNYIVNPYGYSPIVSVADGFRFLFYAVLFVGSMRAIWWYWRALSDAAVLEERGRIARDLHDGLVQELAYLARNLDPVTGPPDEQALRRLHGAALRAQLQSRQAISMLAAPPDQAFDVALAGAAGDIARQLGVELDVDLTPGVLLSPARAEALIRVGCEAISNAARHSGAGRVRLSLDRVGHRVRLRVSDRGRGFDVGAPSEGFGLTSMRERIRLVGGDIRLNSACGHGTEVEVTV